MPDLAGQILDYRGRKIVTGRAVELLDSGSICFTRIFGGIKPPEVFGASVAPVNEPRQLCPAPHRQIHRLIQRETAHSSLPDQTPDEAYLATLPAIKSAA